MLSRRFIRAFAAAPAQLPGASACVETMRAPGRQGDGQTFLEAQRELEERVAAQGGESLDEWRRRSVG
jgi:hypothetical protein